MIALLGRRDNPTDGVEDYCNNLSGALAKRGHELQLVRVPWAEMGWIRGLRSLWVESRGYTGGWTLVQYTALAWSRHGFSVGLLAVLWLLKARRTRLAVIFHDLQPYTGTRLVDRVKRVCQRFVMKCAYRFSAVSIFTAPLEQVSWLPPKATKGTFVPVGANICGRGASPVEDHGQDGHATIVVFGVTDGGDISKEVSDIALAARKAAERVAGVRLVTLGRGSLEAQPSFRRALEGSTVEFSALGVLPAQQVSQILADADVSLFVRGRVSTQRTTATASIASGLPLVAYADAHLPAPLADAGVVPVLYLDGQELAEATARVLTDNKLWHELRDRSLRAYEKYFSWESVAHRLLKVLPDA